ncbi:hypothetical protein MLD38_011939 [Melastoma candidum]|uniref:Uncharacterized protein n=1 Tax=Melastoma candidum TaxID=119954 RepID=A0ACB9R4T5_9MYRT|nr:hypothetical protein MLD38_011939 [Melastoma candidum]
MNALKEKLSRLLYDPSSSLAAAAAAASPNSPPSSYSSPHQLPDDSGQTQGSTLKHGISLRTLIRKSVDSSGPCLLIVGDKQGAVFGGMLQSLLRPTTKRKYQGSNQTFVFTTLHGQPRLFRATVFGIFVETDFFLSAGVSSYNTNNLARDSEDD